MERRRPIVEQLAKQGYTQGAIAIQLGVSQNTIHHDLETLSIIDNVKGEGKDTLGRKRSTGRPKGGGGKHTGPQPARRTDVPQAAELVLDRGMTYDQAAEATDSTLQVVRASVMREEGRREAQPLITPDMLSMSAREKGEAWLRQEKKRMQASFEDTVQTRVREHLEAAIKSMNERYEEYQAVIEGRRGFMTGRTFRLILSCLHPDSRKSLSDERLSAAFRAFQLLEKRVLDEKESPTPRPPDLPRNLAELMEARRKRTAERSAAARARRAGRTNVSVK